MGPTLDRGALRCSPNEKSARTRYVPLPSPGTRLSKAAFVGSLFMAMLVASSASANAAAATSLKSWHAPYAGTETTHAPGAISLGCTSGLRQSPIHLDKTTGAISYSASGYAHTCTSSSLPNSSFLMHQFEALEFPSFTHVSGTHLVEMGWNLSFKISEDLSGVCGGPQSFSRAYVLLTGIMYDVTTATTGSSVGFAEKLFLVSGAGNATGSHSMIENRSLTLSSNVTFNSTDSYSAGFALGAEAEGLAPNNASYSCHAHAEVLPLSGSVVATATYVRVV